MAPLWPPFTKTYHHEPYPTIVPTQDHLSCKGLTVLVTGAGAGIGRAIAVAFAQAHARGIILLGRTEASLEETADAVRAASDGHTEPLVAVADITKADTVQAAMAKAQQTFSSPPDILINNAGGMLARGSIADLDLTAFWATYELNVLGTLTVFQAFIRAAQAADADAAAERTVINIPSGAAHLPYAPGSAAYATSKLASAKLTEYVHHEHRGWRVFNMQPGVVATELARRAGRAGEDVAELPAAAAVWLARDPRARQLNGRFVWANWDVDELLAMGDEIRGDELLTLGLNGWARGFTADDLMARVKQTLAEQQAAGQKPQGEPQKQQTEQK